MTTPLLTKQGLTLLLLLYMGSLAVAQDSPPEITIAMEGQSITIGDDDMSDWDAIDAGDELELLKAHQNQDISVTGEDDIAATFKSTYDAQFLYLMVDVTDDIIWVENDLAFQNDGIELTILTTDNSDLRASWSHNAATAQPGQQKFLFNVTDESVQRLIDRGNSADGDYTGAMSHVMYKMDGDNTVGYRFEVALPWTGLAHGTDFMPTAGTRFSMNLAVNDNDDEPHATDPTRNDHREHILYWSNDNTNRNGEQFGFVVLGESENGGTSADFSNISYFGNSDNYDFFVNPEGTQGATLADWTVIDVMGDAALSLTNGNINPVHPTGTPYFNPDATLYTDGQFSAPGARAIVADTSFTDFEMTVDIMRPEDQISNFYDVAVFFGYEDKDNFGYTSFGIHPDQPTSTIVKVEEGEGLRSEPDPRFSGVLPTLPKDDEYHSVLLRREGNQVALFIDGTPVMFTSDDDFTGEGSVGVGSWNDNGIYDNLNVVALEGDYSSKMSFITASDVATVTFDSLTGISPGLTGSELLEGITLSAGASAQVQDASGTAVGDDIVVVMGSNIVVTSEAGNTKTYGLSFGPAAASNRIEAVFSPVALNDDSTAISTLEGTDVALLLDRIRHPAGAIEQVVDADGNVITDGSTLVTEEMEYQIVGEDGVANNYPITILAPTYPTANIARATDIVMDGLFTEWPGIEQQFDIDGTSKNANLADTMPTAEDISGYYKAAWDEKYLYLYFNVTDDVLNASAAQSFRNDGIEIALLMPSSIEGRSQYNLFFDQANQPGNQKLVYTYGADWNKTLDNSNLGPFNKSGPLFAGAIVEGFAKDDGTGYEVEMQLPWSALNRNDNEVSDEAITPAVGESFSINVSINDNDGGDERQSVKYWASPQLNRDGTDFGIFTLAETTSTRPSLGNFALSIFPNPSSDQLNIQTDKTLARVTVMSMTGQTLFETTEQQVDISNLKTGAYLLRIQTTDHLIGVARFIKK
jgi:hypothetical protein